MMDMMTNAQIGERIRLARTAAGMKQSELADMISVSNGNLVDYEGGNSGMKLDTIRCIAIATGVTPGYLMGFEEMNLDWVKDFNRAELAALAEARKANGSATPAQKALRRAIDLLSGGDSSVAAPQ
jgi:transcriptional regulator with XRE-family HTH domain